jgi:porphobilinogen synthase
MFERYRQYRINEKVRNSFAEVKLLPNDFILPHFVVEGYNKKEPVKSLTGIDYLSVDKLLNSINEKLNEGINKFLLFGCIENELKDELASYAWHEDNIVSVAIKEIKKNFPQVILFADVCMCGYSSLGHCGVVKNNVIDNDETLSILAKISLCYAKSGVDFVAPSAMMDGQVKFIRDALNRHGFNHTKILSYSTKFCSNLYGPFRDVVNSVPVFGDRTTYQADYRSKSIAIMESLTDKKEGADWLMIKPAHTYLDIINELKRINKRSILTAYHVSGEYMMIKLLSENNKAYEYLLANEVLSAIKRAGADYIITYYANDSEFIKSIL